MLVSVVVVAARQPRRLTACLDAVRRGAGATSHEVVVVLNAAEPGLGDAVVRAMPEARLVASAVPLGFAGGANLGVAHARGDLLHLLHDDALPEPGWLDALVSALDFEPRAGSAGSVLLELDTDLDTGEVQAAGAVLWRDGLTTPLRAVPDEVTAVDYCPSASLLVRRDAWTAVGGLDEELHPGQYVDVALALALAAHGYLTVVTPRSRVRHASDGTASERQKQFAAERNRSRVAAEWADQLARQAARGEVEADLARAADHTRRRTDAIRAVDPRPAAAAPAAPVDDHDRERRGVLRELAFRRDYARALEAALDRADTIEAEAVDMHAEIARLHEAYRIEREARLAKEAELDRAMGGDAPTRA